MEPRLDPCGTPHLVSLACDFFPFIIGGPIQCVVSYRDQCALLYTLLYKYPKAGNSFTVIN